MNRINPKVIGTSKKNILIIDPGHQETIMTIFSIHEAEVIGQLKFIRKQLSEMVEAAINLMREHNIDTVIADEVAHGEPFLTELWRRFPREDHGNTNYERQLGRHPGRLRGI